MHVMLVLLLPLRTSAAARGVLAPPPPMPFPPPASLHERLQSIEMEVDFVTDKSLPLAAQLIQLLKYAGLTDTDGGTIASRFAMLEGSVFNKHSAAEEDLSGADAGSASSNLVADNSTDTIAQVRTKTFHEVRVREDHCFWSLDRHPHPPNAPVFSCRSF